MYSLKAAAATVALCACVMLGGMSCTSMEQGMWMGAKGQDLLATGLVGWQQIEGRQDSWQYADGVLSVAEGGGGVALYGSAIRGLRAFAGVQGLGRRQ